MLLIMVFYAPVIILILSAVVIEAFHMIMEILQLVLTDVVLISLVAIAVVLLIAELI